MKFEYLKGSEKDFASERDDVLVSFILQSQQEKSPV